MSSRLTATSKLHRFACFNKQYQSAECMSLNSRFNAAVVDYSDAEALAAGQGIWKSVSANEHLDVFRYGEALKYEAAALDLANQARIKMRLVESELFSAKEELLNMEATAKSVDRRLNKLRHDFDLSDEKRRYDQQNDLLSATRGESK